MDGKMNLNYAAIEAAMQREVTRLMDGLAELFPGCELTLIVRNSDQRIVGTDTVISCEPDLEQAAKTLRTFIDNKKREAENVLKLHQNKIQQ